MSFNGWRSTLVALCSITFGIMSKRAYLDEGPQTLERALRGFRSRMTLDAPYYAVTCDTLLELQAPAQGSASDEGAACEVTVGFPGAPVSARTVIERANALTSSFSPSRFLFSSARSTERQLYQPTGLIGSNGSNRWCQVYAPKETSSRCSGAR